MALIFAIRAGMMAKSAFPSTGLKIIVLAFAYGIVGILMGFAWKGLGLPDYFRLLQKFSLFGILLYILLAFALAIWGVRIIKAEINSQKESVRFRMAFSLICLASMLLSITVLSGVMDTVRAGALTGMTFTVLICASAFLSEYISRIAVGFSTLMLALYFVIAILIVPVYSKASAVFSLTGSTLKTDLSCPQAVIIAGIGILFFSLGYIKSVRGR